ncbi:MAG: epoxyqueuosine reductase QueH [Paludibacteraceae bacterium]|nr:epoxyqueuosine reductase QueH [Paludibacteraceae bacterium]
MFQLNPPAEGRLLLHACCAPCSLAIVECLLQNGIRPTLFFYNPNIFPEEEYIHRKEEIIRYAKLQGIDCVDADYDHQQWLEDVCGLENEPERGARCLRCFYLRLKRSAEYAHEHGFSVVATTLATSRWKSLEQVSQAGRLAVEPFEDLVFWGENWRKGGLQQRRSELLQRYQFYNQNYCGCEFSKRDVMAKEAAKNIEKK